MKVQLFAIRDSKAQAFLQPFFSSTKGTAIRAFTDGVNDPQTSFHKYPDDFTLFHIAEFDDESGVVSPLQQPLAVINAFEVLNAPQGNVSPLRAVEG